MFFTNSKKEFFKKKLRIAWEQVWEWEFKKKQYIIMKEDMRLEYDRMAENLPAYKIRLEKLENKVDLPADLTQGAIDEDIANTKQAISDRERDIEQIKTQMAGMDQHVAQADANIDGGRAVIEMVVAEIKLL